MGVEFEEVIEKAGNTVSHAFKGGNKKKILLLGMGAGVIGVAVLLSRSSSNSELSSPSGYAGYPQESDSTPTVGGSSGGGITNEDMQASNDLMLESLSTMTQAIIDNQNESYSVMSDNNRALISAINDSVELTEDRGYLYGSDTIQTDYRDTTLNNPNLNQRQTVEPITVKVNGDGKAPSGLGVKDKVETAGGTYEITGYNTDGTYKSKLITPAPPKTSTPTTSPKTAPQSAGTSKASTPVKTAPKTTTPAQTAPKGTILGVGGTRAPITTPAKVTPTAKTGLGTTAAKTLASNLKKPVLPTKK